MLDFLELEETVGRVWHRLIGATATWPRFPEHAITLKDLQPVLGVCFRGFGGERTVQIAPARSSTSTHRLRLRQRMGLGEEKLVQPGRDHATLMFPPVVDLFPSCALNRDLYFWLAATMAIVPLEPVSVSDPLLRDLERLDRATQLALAVQQAFPGMQKRYRRLCAAVLAARPARALPQTEQLVEKYILDILSNGAGLQCCSSPTSFPKKAPPGYLPMLPVPLWPEAILRADSDPRDTEDQPATGSAPNGAEAGRHIAIREKADKQHSDRSPFILNRFEKILSMAEMVNVDRPGDDSDDHDASAADELDEMTLGERKGRPSARFRFDLDLPPEALDRTSLTAELSYPEWDYRTSTYMPNYCRVLASPAQDGRELPDKDAETASLIRQVRRQFEVLRPRHEVLKAQLDGSDLDLDAVVRARSDIAAGGSGSDRIHLMSRPQAHDLAVTILVDVSLSTDAWFDNKRVLDVEKKALLVLSHGLAACGDNHSILTFTSRRRSWVRVETVKDFDEAMSGSVESRIAALKPGFYTRIGPAIRHASVQLQKRSERRKLLLLLTDGKPNDVDHYEGRFAIEDSRCAVVEARRSGVNVFGVTVDKEAQSYIPAIFGQNGYAIVGNIARLPATLPSIYRSLAG